MLAVMRQAFDCQKLSLQPRGGNADDSYQGRPRLFTEGLLVSWKCVMWDKCSNKSAPKPSRPPLCFGCARPMQLVRRTSRFGGLPEVFTFDCRACGVSHIEEGDAVVGRLADLGAILEN